MDLSVSFTPDEQNFLALIFVEVFGGGSTQVIQNILGDYVEPARLLESKVRLQAESKSSSLDLTVNEWRILYEGVNAVIYGLGPRELHTCTGYNLQEVCNINLKICAAVWGAYGV
jgi:hypothetical protein